MAKIITENFKVETTNELYTSFKSQNGILANNFENQLSAYNTAFLSPASRALLTGDITDIKAFVTNQLEVLRPESDYYIMASRALTDIEGVPVIQNTQKDKRDFQRKVIFGAKISEDSARYMFFEKPWIAGSRYDAFDDTIDIEDLNCIVTIRSADDDYLVFKCIENNNGGLSTTSPHSVVSELADSAYQSVETTDKYIWQYMFTVPSSEAETYKTSDSLPLPAGGGDPNVIANAKECVSQIVIESTPPSHFNQFIFDIRDNGLRPSNVTALNNEPIEGTNLMRVKLGIQNTSVLSNITGHYTRMYLRSGEGDTAGKLYDIISSKSSALTSEITVEVETTDTLPPICQLVPKISVTEGSIDGERCKAYGVIDNLGTLVRVAFENKGSKYKIAEAEAVNPKGLSDETPTTLRVVISPTGGHGSNPINEIAMSRIAVVVNFSGENANTPKSYYYTQVGLLKNPEFVGGGQPSTFDNRTVATFTGDKTLQTAPGRFAQQFIKTEDVKQFQPGRHYTVVDPGNMSISEWGSIGVSPDASGNIPAGLTFYVDPSNSTILDSSRTGKISSAVTNFSPDEDIETITAKVHQSDFITSPSEVTKVYFTDYTGPFKSKIHPGPITIKNRADSAGGDTININTFSNIEHGDYVPYTGQLLHYLDFSPIERTATTKEKIKFLFDF